MILPWAEKMNLRDEELLRHASFSDDKQVLQLVDACDRIMLNAQEKIDKNVWDLENAIDEISFLTIQLNKDKSVRERELEVQLQDVESRNQWLKNDIDKLRSTIREMESKLNTWHILAEV